MAHPDTSTTDDAPEGLSVQPTLEGFHCEVRRRPRLGSNSAWLVVFVICWWAVSLIVMIALTELVPGLLDRRIDTLPGWVWILGPIGLIGWAPGWMAYDAMRSAATQTMEVTATSLRVGDASYLLTDLVGIRRRGAELFVEREHGDPVGVGARGLTHRERIWLQKRLAEVIASHKAPDQPAPAELASLLDRARE